MPIQPINYAGMPLLDSPWDQDFGEILKRGMQLGQEPGRLARAREQEQLANALGKESVAQAQAITPYAAQQAEADLIYKLAKAKSAEQQASMPFWGRLTGVANEALSLEILKQQYGPDSEVYRNAAKRYQADLDSQYQLNDYRKMLGGTSEKRASTQLGKMEMEIADIMNRKDLSTQQKASALSRYDLARQKQISDSDSRKRALFASNVDKTLDNINPKSLVQYGGILGQAKLKKDEIQAGLGKPTKDYMAYQDSLTGAKLLSKQIRQFYGDSITPQVQEQLAEMVNPATWSNNPEVALKKFNRFKKILQAETETYRSALKETKEFSSSDQKERNMELLRKQRAMAEALKNQQPKMIGEEQGKPASPIKRFKYVNGAWVNA